MVAKNVADYFALREDTVHRTRSLEIREIRSIGVWLLTRSYFGGSSASERARLDYRLAEESLEFFTRGCGDARRPGRAFDLEILKFHRVSMALVRGGLNNFQWLRRLVGEQFIDLSRND